MRGAILPLCLLQAVFVAVGDSQPTALSGFAAARQRMVQEQLSVPGRDIKNRLLLDAMATVPRHEFVPESLCKYAYWDEPLPIGYGQTISQPFIVAFMTEQLNPKPTDRVLEIGTGSGYQAAILSLLVAEVYTIEIIEPLAKRAEADLSRLGFFNVKVLAGVAFSNSLVLPIPPTPQILRIGFSGRTSCTQWTLANRSKKWRRSSRSWFRSVKSFKADCRATRWLAALTDLRIGIDAKTYHFGLSKQFCPPFGITTQVHVPSPRSHEFETWTINE